MSRGFKTETIAVLVRQIADALVDDEGTPVEMPDDRDCMHLIADLEAVRLPEAYRAGGSVPVLGLLSRLGQGGLTELSIQDPQRVGAMRLLLDAVWALCGRGPT